MVKVEQEYKKEANERHAENMRRNQKQKINTQSVVNLPPIEKAKVSEKMAEKIGVSEKTYRNMRTSTPCYTRVDPGGLSSLYKSGRQKATTRSGITISQRWQSGVILGVFSVAIWAVSIWDIRDRFDTYNHVVTIARYALCPDKCTC